MILRLWQGAAGGLLAGTGVGLAEAVWVLSQVPTGEYLALAVGALAYGAAGLLLGCGLGLGLVVLDQLRLRCSEPTGFSLSAVGTGCVLGSWVLVYQGERAFFVDVGLRFAERFAIFGLVGALGLAGLWLLPVFLTRTPLKVMLRPRGALAAWLAVVGLAVLFAASPGTSSGQRPAFPDREQDPELDNRPDIVLITVESWRQDAVPGPGGGELLGIRAIDQAGLHFPEHVATSSWYRSSLASVMTGQYPLAHGVDAPSARLHDDRFTLAEVLAERGYVTGAFPSRGELEYALGFDQGFDWTISKAGPAGRSRAASALSLRLINRAILTRRAFAKGDWAPVESHRPAHEVVAAARGFIDEARARALRYFVWIHLSEPSPPYISRDGAHWIEGRPGHTLPEHERQRVVSLYLEEVGAVDSAVSEIVTWLQAEEAWDETLIVLVGLNGVEHFEHGGWGSGDTLFDEQIMTPLFVRLPGDLHGGRTVPWQISQVDIAPSIAGLAGVVPPMSWQGIPIFDEFFENWATAPASPPPPARPVVASLNLRGALVEALRAPPWKLVRANERNPRGLPLQAVFDLSRDRTERQNMAGQVGPQEAALSRALREAMAASAAWRTRPEAPRP